MFKLSFKICNVTNIYMTYFHVYYIIFTKELKDLDIIDLYFSVVYDVDEWTLIEHEVCIKCTGRMFRLDVFVQIIAIQTIII